MISRTIILSTTLLSISSAMAMMPSMRLQTNRVIAHAKQTRSFSTQKPHDDLEIGKIVKFGGANLLGGVVGGLAVLTVGGAAIDHVDQGLQTREVYQTRRALFVATMAGATSLGAYTFTNPSVLGYSVPRGVRGIGAAFMAVSMLDWSNKKLLQPQRR